MLNEEASHKYNKCSRKVNYSKLNISLNRKHIQMIVRKNKRIINIKFSVVFMFGEEKERFWMGE